MQEIKSWTVIYRNRITKQICWSAVHAENLDAASKKAHDAIADDPRMRDIWLVEAVYKTIFANTIPAPQDQPDLYRHDTAHETFEDYDEAVACQAAHPGSDITYHPGNYIMLHEEITYDIPENRPHWTVAWPVKN